jgi:hypothetical protein
VSNQNSRLKRLIEEAKATFDDIASSPTPKPLELCDYCNQWPDGGTACCNEYDGSVHYKEPVSEGHDLPDLDPEGALKAQDAYYKELS